MEIGRISAIFRYPIKSMAGQELEVAKLSWHGIEGDRRLAFRRLSDRSGFPWLNASKMPQLLLYRPFGMNEGSAQPLPSHVRTPDGNEYELRSNELCEELATRYGAPLELMNIRQGIFDDASISVITHATADFVCRESGRDPDIRRFRPNILLQTNSSEAFDEDRWVGRTLTFGEGSGAPAVRVTLKDERCMMVNLDPDTAEQDPRLMKTVVRLNDTCAGVYCTVVMTGELRVGQVVSVSD